MFANMPLFNKSKQQQLQKTNNNSTTTNGSSTTTTIPSSPTSSVPSFISSSSSSSSSPFAIISYNNNNNNSTTIMTSTKSSLLTDRNHLHHNQIMDSSTVLHQNATKTTGTTGVNTTAPTVPAPQTALSKPQLVFHCQLAHGSPTGLITGFASVKELYQKIAECYDFPTEEIIFCTLNTHKVDMTKLLGGQIGLDDFIFAHRKGRPKEIEIVKTEDALGLTITDNGSGFAFIKRIKEGSVIDKIPHIMVGDHIEKLNGVNVIGKRHFEVARLLKDIPTGSTFTLRLIEPMKSGFQGIGPRSSGAKGTKKQSYGSGKETLRFKANGNVEIENKFDDVTQDGIDAINVLLDSFMGINDAELATQIWDMGADKTNSMDFAEALDNSDLEAFGFTDDFIIELWGAITDARHGRLKK